MDSNQIVVEYDYERNEGTVEWSQVVFEDVLAVEYRQAACCREADIVGSNEVRILEQSQHLSDTLKLWQESVGHQEWQQKQGGAKRFKHFTIFFDDAGCINLVAAALS